MHQISCCYANKCVVAGIWYTQIVFRSRSGVPLQSGERDTMSKTATIAIPSSNGLFGPPAGVDRPPADAERQHCSSERRSTALWSLKIRRASVPATIRPATPRHGHQLSTKGPDLRALFRGRLASGTDVRAALPRQISRTGASGTTRRCRLAYRIQECDRALFIRIGTATRDIHPAFFALRNLRDAPKAVDAAAESFPYSFAAEPVITASGWEFGGRQDPHAWAHQQLKQKSAKTDAHNPIGRDAE